MTQYEQKDRFLNLIKVTDDDIQYMCNGLRVRTFIHKELIVCSQNVKY